MTSIIRYSLAAVFGLAFLGGCAGAPVYNVSGSPINTNSGKPSLEEVGKAITQAGVNLGWQMKMLKPGQILGTLNLRSHTVIVDITYDTKAYDIKYKDSSNLNYNGSSIHKNYNSWCRTWTAESRRS